MDNDKKIIKQIKSTIKSIKFNFDYRDINIGDNEFGNDYIYQRLQTDKQFCAVRGGATEMRCINEYLSSNTYSQKIKNEISILSGVFPNDDDTLNKFCECYIESISQADLIALWGVGAEAKVIHKYCNNSKFTLLRSLEPYYFNNPWSSSLKNKKVLVIHPFAQSIKNQYQNRDKLWNNNDILPEFKSLECIMAVQSIAGQKTDYSNWFDALDYMKNEIAKKDFDVAIIGAGAYGLPLAAYVKSLGKQAIQMSGATQILFGIKGKRWDNHPVISKFYNDYWTRPLKEETPQQSHRVEGGSYW